MEVPSPSEFPQDERPNTPCGLALRGTAMDGGNTENVEQLMSAIYTKPWSDYLPTTMAVRDTTACCRRNDNISSSYERYLPRPLRLQVEWRLFAWTS
jgi:hypothetical protein